MSTVPVEQPNLGAAAEGHEDVFLFRADIALLVPLPTEVPLLLAALRDGVAVHSALQVGIDTEKGNKKDCQQRHYLRQILHDHDS